VHFWSPTEDFDTAAAAEREAISAAHDLMAERLRSGLPFGLNGKIVIGKADVWADEDQHS